MSDSNSNAPADAFGNQSGQDAYYENLLEMQKNKPDEFAKISPAVRIGFGYWLEKKKKENKSNV